MVGRQFDAGESGRFSDESNVAAPVIEDRFVSWNAKVFGGMVHGIQEAVPDPEIDKRQYALVGSGLDGGRPYVVRHTCAVLKEIREPSGLYYPNERKPEHAAGDGNRWVRPGNDGNGRESLQNGGFVLDALNHLGIGECRHELFSAI